MWARGRQNLELMTLNFHSTAVFSVVTAKMWLLVSKNLAFYFIYLARQSVPGEFQVGEEQTE